MIWLVPAILMVAGILIAVASQGAATAWLWTGGTVAGTVLMVAGAAVLVALMLLVA